MTRRRHVMLLLAGVLTLALLRSMFGGLTVFVSIVFGFGALTVWLYQVIAPKAPAAS